MSNNWIVMTAAARMPSSCWGRYRRIALVKITDQMAACGGRPAMISERAHGVIEVRETWEKLSVGTTARCAYRRALAEAEALAAAAGFVDIQSQRERLGLFAVTICRKPTAAPSGN